VLDFSTVRRDCLTLNMKTATVREFYHNAGLVDGLAEGKRLVVTSNGKPKFVVSKWARPPEMARKLAESRAVGDPRGRKFDGTAFLASLKK
jgi:hypothetical protein